MTWEDKHKERVYINNLAIAIHDTKERLTGGKHLDEEGSDCTCYKQAMEHYIKYGMATDDVDAQEW